jgi:hypothetical protein
MKEAPHERAIAATKHSEAVLARIRGVDLIVSQIVHWPTFHDFEVISVALERSPLPNLISKELRAVFYIFNLQAAHGTRERRPGHAEIVFHDIDELCIRGFNYQNPIMGLGLKLSRCERLKRDVLDVEWGGTCMAHDVNFRCDRITIVRVIDLDPFGKGANA